jgi:hypothetical protein
MTVTYSADIWLGLSDSFGCPDRETAAEAFADAMRVVGCETAFQAFTRLGMDSTGYARWWELPVTAFNILRYEPDGETIDATFRGVFGTYKQPAPLDPARTHPDEDAHS